MGVTLMRAWGPESEFIYIGDDRFGSLSPVGSSETCCLWNNGNIFIGGNRIAYLDGDVVKSTFASYNYLYEIVGHQIYDRVETGRPLFTAAPRYGDGVVAGLACAAAVTRADDFRREPALDFRRMGLISPPPADSQFEHERRWLKGAGFELPSWRRDGDEGCEGRRDGGRTVDCLKGYDIGTALGGTGAVPRRLPRFKDNFVPGVYTMIEYAQIESWKLIQLDQMSRHLFNTKNNLPTLMILAAFLVGGIFFKGLEHPAFHLLLVSFLMMVVLAPLSILFMTEDGKRPSASFSSTYWHFRTYHPLPDLLWYLKVILCPVPIVFVVAGAIIVYSCHAVEIPALGALKVWSAICLADLALHAWWLLADYRRCLSSRRQVRHCRASGERHKTRRYYETDEDFCADYYYWPNQHMYGYSPEEEERKKKLTGYPTLSWRDEEETRQDKIDELIRKFHERNGSTP